MNNIIAIIVNIVFLFAAAYVAHKFRWRIFPFCATIATPAFGNSFIAVVLAADGTFPSLTQWTGSAGNIHFFKNIAKDSTEDSVTTAVTEFRTNDDALYGNKITYDGITKFNFYGRAMLDVTFISVAAKAALEAGQKILIISNIGYENGKWMETIKIGDIMPNRVGKDNDEKASLLEFKSTPPGAAFTLSAANITAIEAVSATNYVVRCAGPHVVPVAPYPEILVYT